MSYSRIMPSECFHNGPKRQVNGDTYVGRGGNEAQRNCKTRRDVVNALNGMSFLESPSVPCEDYLYRE